MSGFIEGENRQQSTLFPERVDDYVAEDSPVRVVDVFIDGLDISGLGFKTEAKDTGRPGYHPRTLLKIYVYGYLNQVHSSRRLEREAQRNVELMWLTGRLAPDFKTIADFRKDNGEAIRLVCREFVMLCKKVNLLTDTLVAIDGSKFKAVNNRPLHGELLPAFRGQPILPHPLAFLGDRPVGLDPALSGQPVQRRIERAGFHLEHVLGVGANHLRDTVAVARAGEEGLDPDPRHGDHRVPSGTAGSEDRSVRAADELVHPPAVALDGEGERVEGVHAVLAQLRVRALLEGL